MGELTKAHCDAQLGWGSSGVKDNPGYDERCALVNARTATEYAGVEPLQLAVLAGEVTLSALRVEPCRDGVTLVGVRTPDGEDAPWRICSAEFSRGVPAEVAKEREEGVLRILAGLAGVDAAAVLRVDWRRGEKKWHPNRVTLVLK